MAGKIGHEQHRALQHADQERGATGVVSRDLRPEFSETALEGLLRNDDVTEFRVIVRMRKGRCTCKCFGHEPRS